MEKKLTTIKCDDCGEEEEYIDDGVTVDCMPDGCLIGDGKWICQECCYKRGISEEG